MIAEMLDYGQENAVKISVIADRLGLSYRATARRIERERINGAEIASCNNGVFKPVNAAERREYLTRADKRARMGFAVSRAVREALNGIEGQECIG